ncbi:hypothetical protein LPN01_02510 [Sphingomonas sp. A2-49]|uniref:DUF6883 domain-containing protein n=1 Tax=Sphingomonas sp. A2-49 TaxID=1391375 RepID=UPI0021D26A19|nr:DUF6883 domain-containing protein [Sphingomonas sp. A2-49]MCU6452943.1 hypothetical protein [Sphingomonas sp. A2-49]
MTDLPGPRIVEMAKIRDYLLSDSHPTGRAKAAFFRSFGFTLTDAVGLAAAIDQHGATRPVVGIRTNDFGIKHEVRCTLIAPDGRQPCIITIWLQAAGETSVRLISASPAKV